MFIELLTTLFLLFILSIVSFTLSIFKKSTSIKTTTTTPSIIGNNESIKNNESINEIDEISIKNKLYQQQIQQQQIQLQQLQQQLQLHQQHSNKSAHNNNNNKSSSFSNEIFKNFKIFSGSILVIDIELNILSSSESVRDIFTNINDINGVNQKAIGSNLNYNFLNLVYQQDKDRIGTWLKSKFNNIFNNIIIVEKNELIVCNSLNGNIEIEKNEIHFKAIYHINNTDLAAPFNLQVSILPFTSSNYIVLSLKDLSPPPLKLNLNKPSIISSTFSPRSTNISNTTSSSSTTIDGSTSTVISSPRSSLSASSNDVAKVISPRSRSSSISGKNNCAPLIIDNLDTVVVSPRKNTELISSPRNRADSISSPRSLSIESVLNNKSIDMISHLSHELRTPIHSVIASIQLFRSTILTVTQNEYLSIIDTSANTLLEFVSNVLDYKRIRSGKLTLNNVDFNLGHVIEDVCAMVSPQAQAKSLQIASFIFIHCPLSFYGDPIRLRQVLLNLIGNGLKYTNTGQVCISVEPEQVRENCMYLHFQVKDSGIGIKEENMSKLFAGFSQVNNGGTTQEALGSGLGLAISKDLVELMGGKIWCTSNATTNNGESGCTFHFVIPLETNPKQLPCPIQNFNGLSILVVDKNPSIQTVLCQYLEGWNCQVIKSSDINEASNKLKDLRRQQIEVVMIDIDKIDFRDFIQFKEAFNRLEFGRIGLITMSSDRSMVNEMGFGTSKLTKPFRQSHLIACLLASMPEHSSSTTSCFSNIVGINNHNQQLQQNNNQQQQSFNSNGVYGNGNYGINNHPSPLINKHNLLGNSSSINNRRMSVSMDKIPHLTFNGTVGPSAHYKPDSPRAPSILKSPRVVTFDPSINSNNKNSNNNNNNHNNNNNSSGSSNDIINDSNSSESTTPPLNNHEFIGSYNISINNNNNNSSNNSTDEECDTYNTNDDNHDDGGYEKSYPPSPPLISKRSKSQPASPVAQKNFYGRVTRRHSIDIIMFENSKELLELKLKDGHLDENGMVSPRNGNSNVGGGSQNLNSSSNGQSVNRNGNIGSIKEEVGGTSNSGSLAHGQSPNSLSPRSPTKIMILDDAPVSLILMQRILERSGFECYPFGSSIKALESLEQVNPEIIFMDCEMPGMNGFECTRSIRKKEQESNCLLKDRKIIIALTAHINPEIQTKCFGAGMDDFISKPFKPEDLDKIIKKWEGSISDNNLNYANSLLNQNQATIINNTNTSSS